MNRNRRMAAMITAVILLLSITAAMAEETAAVTDPPAVTEAPAYPTLAYGAKGEAVTQLQNRLRELGYLSGEADGIYGQDTRRAVSAFQRRNGLDQDGKAGPKTQAVLYSENALGVPEKKETDVLAGELPLLVNREHTVDEYFVPANLVLLKDRLDPKLVKIKYDDTMAVTEAVDALERMLTAAKADGITKWQVSSAYRSWQGQEKMLANKISSLREKNKGWGQARARKAALRTVAEPGCSEHQTGLAIDINVPGAAAFHGTKQCKWLHAHCWEYGFIVRYPKGKEKITGFDAEAWHIRYVGEACAEQIHELDMCLEEYLEGIEAGVIIPAGRENDIPEVVVPDDDPAGGEDAA